MENINNTILEIRDLCVAYTADKLSVSHVSTDIPRNQITAIMGPSGCGKSTLLRAINRMHELYRGIQVSGELLIDGQDLLKINAMRVRREVGMVFQRPNPFPTMSIADNVLAGYSLNGIRLEKSMRQSIVEQSLKSVGLWNEVKDSLTKRGTFLSGGQQQRLCIARALALKPKLILMDEPTSALDPIATTTIENLLVELKNEVSIIIVTHNMGQAKRISQKSLFMYLGELVEGGSTEQMFSDPADRRTKSYLSGNIG
ncbi:MAG: phosphate ABC transporter ATP-binding protein [Bacteroidales bacterium]|nr:phosphate ABC transporter ATP-binding protein [Candidatus Colimorpha merdihippi]